MHKTRAVAENVVRRELYVPSQRPGYSAWAVPWRSPRGAVYLHFIEKRRAMNLTWQPVPLDFYEGMMSPRGYHVTFCDGAQSVRGESVILRSDDEARTFREVGRSPARVMNQFCWASLADGSIMRVLSNDYIAFDPSAPTQMTAEISRDEGNTWEKRSDILEGFFTYTYRLRRLSDGVLVLVVAYAESFGPGRARATRQLKRRGIDHEITCGVFVSHDEGRHWSGPLTAFPGIEAWEPDFVELRNGDLLFINSTVQLARQARQFFIRRGDRFVPGPVRAIDFGTAPETVVLTDNCQLVGAIRSGNYVCSNDMGASWHKIEGIGPCHYQPYMLTLTDGSLFCAWHKGGDDAFGEVDQCIGDDRFTVRAELPLPRELSIERLKSDDSSRFINAFRVRLTAGGKGLARQAIRFGYHLRYTEAYDRTDDPRRAGEVVSAVTDSEGYAVLDLRSQLSSVTDVHHSYRIAAWHEPEKDADTAPVQSDICMAYTLTMTADELALGAVEVP